MPKSINLNSILRFFVLTFYSQFEDIFDVDYFIQSLKHEVRILKQLPPELKAKFQQKYIYSMPPASWSNMSYYYNSVIFWSQLLLKFPLSP